VLLEEVLARESNIKGKNIKKYNTGKEVKTVIYVKHRGMKY